MGSLIAVLNAPTEDAARAAFERAAARSAYRGAAQCFVEGGRALGVQARADDASLCVASQAVVAFHGYVTNRDALRLLVPDALEPNQSVAELLAALWVSVGAGLFSLLRGEYAVAVFDRRNQTLLFTSSLLGGRPLYYKTARGMTVVATEPRQVAAGLKVALGLTLVGFMERLTFGHSLTERDRTIYRGLYRVFPPHIYENRYGTGLVESRQKYWSVPEVQEELASDIDALRQELRSLLFGAVRDTLDEQPVGLALSGGLDSTTILAILTDSCREATASGQVRPYAVRYPGLPIDEGEYIAALHAHLGTTGTEIDATKLVPSGFFELHAETVDHLMIGGTESNLDILARHIQQDGCARFMTGVFVEGWLTNLPTYALDLWESGRPLDYFRHSMGFNDNDEPPWGRVRWRRTLGYLAAPPGGWLRRRFRTPKPEWLHDSLVPQFRAAMHALHEPFRLYGWGQGRVMQSVLAHAGGMSVEVIEQIAARYGLDPRHPLMDQRLVEFGLRVPAAAITQGKRHKELMRQAVGTLLPDKVRERDAKLVHNLAVERDISALEYAPAPGEWRLVEAGIVDQRVLENYIRSTRQQGRVPRSLGILIKAEVFWRRHG